MLHRCSMWWAPKIWYFGANERFALNSTDFAADFWLRFTSFFVGLMSNAVARNDNWKRRQIEISRICEKKKLDDILWQSKCFVCQLMQATAMASTAIISNERENIGNNSFHLALASFSIPFCRIGWRSIERTLACVAVKTTPNQKQRSYPLWIKMDWNKKILCVCPVEIPH